MRIDIETIERIENVDQLVQAVAWLELAAAAICESPTPEDKHIGERYYHRMVNVVDSSPGVADIRLLCDGRGGAWTADWLREQRGHVADERKLTATGVDAMTLPDFAAALLGTISGEADCYVGFMEMGPICHRSARWARRLYDDGLLPPPAIQGGKGRPHEWRWGDVRETLERESGRQLPAIFPADRFVRD
jgi:hypothetical protein